MSAPSANRLAGETSPYLLQHAANPVDWHPWGEEALERARREDKPIFLSVGYSACHWCHVMEHESFEDEAVAALMNRWFVNVKVDREERPDVDEIYMRAVQTLTGQGGWPMSVFLTPALEPFFGGTYFPPDDRHGRPGFASLLRSMAALWERDRERVVQQGHALAERIAQEGRARLEAELAPDLLDRSLAAQWEVFDPRWGGFGNAPKFPHTGDVRLALRHHLRSGDKRALEMATTTLEAMARGGIRDHLGGGFARYSTDERWLVPHFEKMLYDNALLVPAYVEAGLATGQERWGRVAAETCDWMLEAMSTPEGGLASSLDADSEGEEGRYYAWSPEELEAVLGPERGRWAAAWYGVTPGGTFEHGRSVLWRPEPAEEVARSLGLEVDRLSAAMEEARTELLEARGRRVPPDRDDKVLTAWNGLAVSALAQAHRALGNTSHLAGAQRVARYLLEGLRQPDGRLFATARHGRARHDGTLDDYAFTIQGLLDLYEADFDPGWIDQALELDEALGERFEDREAGGYFTTPLGRTDLIARLKSPMDGALPAGNGVQALNLLRLAELTGGQEHAVRAERTLRAFGAVANRHPVAFSQLLVAVDFLAAGPREIVLAGERESAPFQALLATVRSRFLPQAVVAHATPAAEELLAVVAGKTAPPGQARAFVCRGWTCGLPAGSAEELARQLDGPEGSS